MCLYNYNNKFNYNDTLDNEQLSLLNKIYKSIDANDNESTRVLTQQLISMQTSQKDIDVLQGALNSLK